jgi:hypothetical protein
VSIPCKPSAGFRMKRGVFDGHESVTIFAMLQTRAFSFSLLQMRHGRESMEAMRIEYHSHHTNT